MHGTVDVKARGIATDKVIVVSWKGFYRPAVLKAEANDINTITPEPVTGTVNETSTSPCFEQPRNEYGWWWRTLMAHKLSTPTFRWAPGCTESPLANGWSCTTLPLRCCKHPRLAMPSLSEVIKAEESINDPWIDYEAAINGDDFFVHDYGSDTDLVITAIEVAAAMEYQRTPLDFELASSAQPRTNEGRNARCADADCFDGGSRTEHGEDFVLCIDRQTDQARYLI